MRFKVKVKKITDKVYSRLFLNRLRKNSFFTGCSKKSRNQAPETGNRPEGVGLSGPRREEISKIAAYIEVRRNDEKLGKRHRWAFWFAPHRGSLPPLWGGFPVSATC